MQPQNQNPNQIPAPPTQKENHETPTQKQYQHKTKNNFMMKTRMLKILLKIQNVSGMLFLEEKLCLYIISHLCMVSC